jgi:diguanylate cyclase (GGDEF)-like protein
MFDSLRTRIADAIAPELAERRKLLEREANTDALTGLANRRAFDLARAGAEADPQLAILVIDADHFGQVNKLRGQVAGDKLLQALARRIVDVAASFGLGARCFRIGGDEFAILVPVHQVAALRSQIERIRHQVADHLIVTLTGTYGPTYGTACAQLQARKQTRKGDQS